MGAYVLRSDAKRLARELAGNKELAPAEARRQAKEHAATLAEPLQRAIFVSLWQGYYTKYLAARCFAELLTQALIDDDTEV